MKLAGYTKLKTNAGRPLLCAVICTLSLSGFIRNTVRITT